MNRILVYIISLTFLLNSCKTQKGITDSGTAKKMSIAKIIKKNNTQQTDFKTLRANLKVTHLNTKNQNQNLTVGLRILKDQKIWMSFKKAGFSGGKALITPQKVQFYNKLDNTFFDGDFKFISNMLGTELNFKQLQSVLVGESIFTLEPAQYDLEVLKDGYLVYPEVQAQLYEFFTTINPTNFKIKTQEISQPQKHQILTIDYNSYQDIEGQLLPLNIHLATVQKTKGSQTDILYKNVSLNGDMNFPFTIPTGYKAITFE